MKGWKRGEHGRRGGYWRNKIEFEILRGEADWKERIEKMTNIKGDIGLKKEKRKRKKKKMGGQEGKIWTRRRGEEQRGQIEEEKRKKTAGEREQKEKSQKIRWLCLYYNTDTSWSGAELQCVKQQ